MKIETTQPLEVLIRRAGVRPRTALEGIATIYHVEATRFAFLVDMPSAQQLERLIMELRTKMLRPLMAASFPISPSFPAGICTVFDEDESSHNLLRKLLVSTYGALDTRAAFLWYSADRDERVHGAKAPDSSVHQSLQRLSLPPYRLARHPRKALP